MELTNFKEIKDIILKKWKKGDILREYFREKYNKDFLLFPWKIKLKSPTSKELSTNTLEVFNWKKALKETDKSVLAYGYNIIEKKINNKIIGKNSIPTHIEILSPEDAIKLIKKEKEVSLFSKNLSFILNKYFELEDWIEKNIFELLREKEEWEKILIVVEYFINNPIKNSYLREISIENIDTKFIEKHKKIIFDLLDEISKKDFSNLEKTFIIKEKPLLIRFRILDVEYYINGFSDISVPLEEFNMWKNNFKYIFFTENEISFLSFPFFKNACIIFGKGYSISVFKDNKWLNTRKLYYWGDIDTHGFNILGMAKRIFPSLKSFLMNEEVFLKHRKFWVKEDKPFLVDVKDLDNDEKILLKKLQENIYGENLRLEQERINFKYLQEYLKKLENND